MARVSVIVITYNAAQWVPRCLESVRSHASAHEIELVVLDNASTAFDIDQVRAWAGPDAVVVGSAENLGFGRGCNRAVEHATGDYVMLLNPDAILGEGAVDALVALQASDREIGIVGGRVTTPDGALDRGSCFGVQTLWSLACFATGLSTAFSRSAVWNPEGLGAWDRDSVRRVGIVTGCLLLLDRALWEDLGGFDERFFMYGEDADLCQRADRIGRQSWITPDATAVHALGASSGTTLAKQVLLYRGKVELVDKAYRGLRRTLGLRLLLGGVLLRARLSSLVGTDQAAYRGLWRERQAWLRGWSDAQSDMPTPGPAGSFRTW